jgi:hypothetical protein
MALREFAAEAWQNLMLHRMRSGLAALGIIFGVASVICMVSISEVARRDVIGRIERMGLGNVIVDSVKPERLRRREQSSEESWIARYGITDRDLEVLQDNLEAIAAVVPLRIMLDDLSANLETSDTTVVGTTPDYARVMGHAVEAGRFLTATDEASAAARRARWSRSPARWTRWCRSAPTTSPSSASWSARGRPDRGGCSATPTTPRTSLTPRRSRGSGRCRSARLRAPAKSRSSR